MPFVTEELWQRLSRRPNDATPSIMVSRYPIYVRRPKSRVEPASLNALQEKEFAFEEADKQFDLLFNTIRAGRSLAASYNLQSDIQSRSGRQAKLTPFLIVYSLPPYTG